MFNRSVAAALTSFLLLVSCQSRAATTVSTSPLVQSQFVSQNTHTKLDHIIKKAMEQQKLVGVALGVVEDGKITYLKGYGWADQATQQPVTLDSSFRWASISKTVTAVLSMQLVAQGHLQLDASIAKYWPDYRNAQGWPVTQRQLLGHLGGVGNYDDVTGWQAGLQNYHRRQLLPEVQGANMVLAASDIFASAPLMNPPGEVYRYSTFGSMLAGAVVEKAGAASYVQQFENRIRQPLGLTSMHPDYGGLQLPHRVSGYYQAQGQIHERQDEDVSWKLAGGGFTSNVGDLTRYMQALINQELLTPEAYPEMWTAQKTLAGKATGYGLSFAVSRQEGLTEIGHFGAQEKTRTVMSFLPERKLGVVIMCNSEWANLAPVRTELLSALLKNNL